MADLEKVISHLQIIHTWASFALENDLSFFTMAHMERLAEWTTDTLKLLKEQKAIKPIYDEEKYGDHLPHCGNCKKVLPDNAVYGKVNFCHYCGKVVKWE